MLSITKADISYGCSLSAAAVEARVSPSMQAMTPCQPTCCDKSPTRGPSMMAPTLPMPFTRLLVGGHIKGSYTNDII